MSNKIDIQNSNLQLQSLIERANSLPQANTWSGNTTITPGTSNTTIPQYNDKALTILGDTDLKASNIKKGVNIFGVTGTLDPSANVINGIIDKYIAQSGTISANSFIEFVSNSAWGANTQISTEEYTGGSNGCSCACKLSDGRILVLVGGSYIGLSGIIVTISGNTITAGATQTLVGSGWSGLTISAVEISENKILITHVYRGDSYFPSAIVATISGDTITCGTRVQISTDSLGTYDRGAMCLVPLSSTRAIVFWARGSYSYLAASILTVSGTSITVNTTKTLNSNFYTGSAVNAVKISDTKLILTYSGNDGSSYNYNTYAAVITVSGTSISIGTSLIINTDNQSYFYSHELVWLENKSKVIIGYRNSSYRPNIAICKVSGTTITLESTLLISNIQGGSSASYNSKISLLKLSDEMLIVLYQGSGTLYGRSVDLTEMKVDEVDTTLLSGMYSFGDKYDWELISGNILFISFSGNGTAGYAYANMGAIPKYHMARLSTSTIGALTKTSATDTTFGECYKL